MRIRVRSSGDNPLVISPSGDVSPSVGLVVKCYPRNRSDRVSRPYNRVA